MSLRLRLTLTLGSAFVLLWALAATWMLFDVRNQLMQSLDQRLAASARMVAGLLVQLPQPQLGEGTRLSAEQLGIENGLGFGDKIGHAFIRTGKNIFLYLPKLRNLPLLFTRALKFSFFLKEQAQMA